MLGQLPAGSVEVLAQSGHARIPELLVIADPLVGGGELLGAQHVAVGPPVTAPLHQPGVQKDAQVLGDGRT